MFLAGGLAFVATRALSGSGEGSVELVAADETGSSPFTPSASRVDDDAVARALDTVTDRAAPGDADRRLALTPISVRTEPAFASGSTICDKARLAAALASDDDARDAWSSLMGIEEDEVQTTLDSFTPLVLLHDTAVTNSRYANGEPSTFQAVLQAGTPVLVDASGQPRVRCTCGNPLSAAATGAEAKITGPRWEQFRPGRVVTLHPSPSEGAEIPTVDLATGGASSIVLGGELTLDGYLVDDKDGVSVVDEGGHRTSILSRPVARVIDDGQGGIVFQYQRSRGEHPWQRDDTQGQSPGSREEATIWRLRAGATHPEAMLTSDDSQQHWFGLRDIDSFNGSRVLAYSELKGPQDCDPGGYCNSFQSSRVVLLDLTSGKETELTELGGAITDHLRIGPRSIVTNWARDDHGGLSWLDTRLRSQFSSCDIDCGVRTIEALDESSFVMLTSDANDDEGVAIARLDNGRTERFFAFGDALPARSPGRSLELSVQDHVAIVSAIGEDGSGLATVKVDLESGDVTPLGLRGRASVLSSPLIRPRPLGRGTPTPTPSLTTTTSTTAPPATVTTTTAPPPTSAVPMRVFDEPDDLIDAFLTAWATNDARLLATLPIPSGLVSALGPMPGNSWMSDCDAVSRSGGGICRVEVGENHPDHWVTLAHFDFKVELKDVDGWNITDGEQTL